MLPHASPAKELFILAGPNGAGKSTSAKVLLPETLGVQHFVNADLIAAGISPFAPELAAVTAGKLMLRRIDELLKRGASFAFKTTLATRGFTRLIRRATDAGYLVHLLFMWLPDPEMAINRVRDRVKRGGHHIPDDIVRRRYERGIRNFFNLYEPPVISWVLCDNSGRDLAIIAQRAGRAAPQIFNVDQFQAIAKRAQV